MVGGQLLGTPSGPPPTDVPAAPTGPSGPQISSSKASTTRWCNKIHGAGHRTAARWPRKNGRWRHLSRTLPPPETRDGHPPWWAHPHSWYGGSLCQTRRSGVTFGGRQVSPRLIFRCPTPRGPAGPFRLSSRPFSLETRPAGVQESSGALRGFGSAGDVTRPLAQKSCIFCVEVRRPFCIVLLSLSLRTLPGSLKLV